MQIVSDRLSIHGWETGTGVRFAIIVDSLSGGFAGGGESELGKGMKGKGVQEGDVRGAFKALQTAYIHLLQNPFYIPDDHNPAAAAAVAVANGGKRKGGEITSRRFIAEVRRIGERWRPGMAVV